MSASPTPFSKLPRIIKFGSVGTLNSLVDFLILNALILVSGQAGGWHFPVFKSIAFTVGVTNSFFFNRFWTFGKRGMPKWEECAKFLSISIAGALLNIGVASFVVLVLPRPEAVNPIFWANIGAASGALVSAFWNFLGYKRIFLSPKKLISDVFEEAPVFIDNQA